MEKWGSRAYVLAQVKERGGMALMFAGEAFDDDREIVLAAVGDCPRAWAFASERLQLDKEVLLASLRGGADAEAILEFMGSVASEEMMDLVGPLISKSLLADPAFVTQLCSYCPRALLYAAASVKTDRRTVVKVLEQRPDAWELVPECLRKDPDVVLAAVKAFQLEECWGLEALFEDAIAALRQDRSFLQAALRANPQLLRVFPEDLLWDRELVLLALKRDGHLLQFAAEALVQAHPGLRTVAESSFRLRGLGEAREATVFEGGVLEEQGAVCVASFPGAYLKFWDQLVKKAQSKKCGTACVFLPASDPKKRFGRHAKAPGSPRCWCHQIYGEPKEWGCLWFEAWLENIKKAAARRQTLLVVHFPFENKRGLVDWEDLPKTGSALWNKVGLGGSQKGEAAYLLRNFPTLVKHVDLLSLHEILPGFDAIAPEVQQTGKLKRGMRVWVEDEGERGTVLAVSDEWTKIRLDSGERLEICGEDPGLVVVNDGVQLQWSFA